MDQNCPLCDCATAERSQIKGGAYQHYRCSNCAEFVIATDAMKSMPLWTRATKDLLIKEAKAAAGTGDIYVITATPDPATPAPWLQGVPRLRSAVFG